MKLPLPGWYLSLPGRPGAKDHPSDAGLLLDLLRQHRDRLRPGNPTRSKPGRMVNAKTRQTNRLTATLKLYFLQILDWFDELD